MRTKKMSEETKPRELNQTQIAFEFGCDPITVRNRLSGAGIQPSRTNGRERLFLITEELKAVIQGTSAKDAEAEKLRLLTAQADERELKVLEKKGELLAVADVKEELGKIFTKLHREFSNRLPKRIANKIKKAKTASDIQKILETEAGAIFDGLRTDYSKFLA